MKQQLNNIPRGIKILVVLILWVIIVFIIHSLVSSGSKPHHKKPTNTTNLPVPRAPTQTSTTDAPPSDIPTPGQYEWSDMAGIKKASLAVGTGFAIYDSLTAKKIHALVKPYLTPELLATYFPPEVGGDFEAPAGVAQTKVGKVTDMIPSEDAQTGARKMTVFYQYKEVTIKNAQVQKWYVELEFAPDQPLVISIKQGQDRQTPVPTPLNG